MISVIVPIYNVEKYLIKCVNSILSQSYSELEIILVDDGSPDNCGKICDELAKKDSRIRVIHQKNSGLAAARNAGLAVARGEYVAFVDSDDTIENDMYLLLYDMMKIDDADISICESRKITEKDSLERIEYSRYRRVLLDNDELWELVFGKLNNASWNKLYKRKLIGDLRFPEKVVHGEDLLFNIEYLTKCNVGAYSEAPMYNYLSRNDSITRSGFNENIFLEIIAKDKAKEFVAEHMPVQLENAEVFSFRARMNVLRSVYAADKELIYQNKIDEIKKYIKQQYRNVKRSLKKKEKIEYELFFSLPSLYRRIAKYYG